MVDYKNMYYQLFNAVTDAQLEIDTLRKDVSKIAFAMQKAQAMSEELYLQAEDDGCTQK